MASARRSIGIFAAGALLGGLLGGVGGYVVNDLTSRENPEVVQQMEEELQTQEDLDDFLNNLESPPTTANNDNSAPSSSTGTPDEAATP